MTKVLSDKFNTYLEKLNCHYSEAKSLTQTDGDDLNALLKKIYDMEDKKQKKYFEEQACNIYKELQDSYDLLKKSLEAECLKNNKLENLVKTFCSVSDKIFSCLHHFLGEKFFLLYRSPNIDVAKEENNIRFERFKDMVYISAQQRKKLNAIKDEIFRIL